MAKIGEIGECMSCGLPVTWTQTNGPKEPGMPRRAWKTEHGFYCRKSGNWHDIRWTPPATPAPEKAS